MAKDDPGARASSLNSASNSVPTSVWLDRIIAIDRGFIQPLMETFSILRPFKSDSTIPAFPSGNQSLFWGQGCQKQYSASLPSSR